MWITGTTNLNKLRATCCWLGMKSPSWEPHIAFIFWHEVWNQLCGNGNFIHELLICASQEPSRGTSYWIENEMVGDCYQSLSTGYLCPSAVANRMLPSNWLINSRNTVDLRLSQGRTSLNLFSWNTDRLHFNCCPISVYNSQTFFPTNLAVHHNSALRSHTMWMSGQDSLFGAGASREGSSLLKRQPIL